MDIDKPKKKIENIKNVNIHSNTFIEKDDIEKAVAFKMEGDSAEVVSIGIGYFAEQIKREAKDNDIPVYESKELTDKLISFDINVPLPPSAYDLIVAFINFVSHVEKDVYKKKESG